VIANALAPEIVAHAMALADQLILPDPTDPASTESHSGWQSLSDWAPSKLTRLSKAALDNNEVPDR
jgi:hypothetical protein